MSAHSDQNRAGAKDDRELGREGKELVSVTAERQLWTGRKLSKKQIKMLVCAVPRQSLESFLPAKNK